MEEIESKYRLTVKTLEHKLQLTEKKTNSDHSNNAKVAKMPFLIRLRTILTLI